MCVCVYIYIMQPLEDRKIFGMSRVAVMRLGLCMKRISSNHILKGSMTFFLNYINTPPKENEKKSTQLQNRCRSLKLQKN